MTAKQLLNKIKHPKVREMALENVNINILNDIFDSLNIFICSKYFPWVESKQGLDFWKYVSRNITEDGDLPADMESKFPGIFGDTELTKTEPQETKFQWVNDEKAVLQQEIEELKKRLEMYENQYGKKEILKIDQVVTIIFDKSGKASTVMNNLDYVEEKAYSYGEDLHVTRRIQAEVLI